MSPFCRFISLLATSSQARDWARDAWGCLVRTAVTAIEDIYGGFRLTPPLEPECQEFNRRAFANQEDCLRQDLCETSFSPIDAFVLAEVMESSGVFRDLNFDQMLRLLADCGEDNKQVAPLRQEMTRRGFVFCVTVNGTQALAADVLRAKELIERAGITGSGRGLAELEGGDQSCDAVSTQRARRSVARRLKRDAHNDTTSVVVALLSNGTAAVSPNTVCGSLMTSELTLFCPVCGDGVLDLSTEVCDDGNGASGDGCSLGCKVEDGFGCNTVPGQRTECFRLECGDGIRVPGEDCDTGGDPGCDNCTLNPAYVCTNPPFDTTVCSECGNGVINAGEECDNGPSAVPDGCNDTCHVLPYFICYGRIEEQGKCRHIDIDLNKFDDTTRNRSLVLFRGGEVVFLVDVRTLNTSEYGDDVSLYLTLKLRGIISHLSCRTGRK